MISIMISLLSILLLCVSASQGRKTLLQSNSSEDGICKSMVETQGYTCEEHKVTTEDGYILSLQRMPAGRSGGTADKPPVLDAVIWLLNSPDESLGFILADNGFEVWLANTRGTKYSSAHTSLNPNDEEYWEWSWDELVSYDLHASVEYVYNHTGQKLHYVGHSLAPFWLGLRKFNPIGQDAAKLFEGICRIPGIKCSSLLTIFTGPNCCINNSRTDVYLEHEPQPTATKNLIHLAQMVRTGKIAMYDYGDQEQNMQHYGQASPPVYDMTSIPKDLPLFLSYGGKDELSDVKDVQLLLQDLKDHDKDKLVVLFREDYAHVYFILGVNAKQLVYEPLMAFFLGLTNAIHDC